MYVNYWTQDQLETGSCSVLVKKKLFSRILSIQGLNCKFKYFGEFDLYSKNN